MPSIDRLVLRISIPVTAVVGALAALIAFLVTSDPGKGVLGAIIGTAIVFSLALYVFFDRTITDVGNTYIF